jgi:hypothetical protein
MNQPAKPLNLQLNLSLVDATRMAVPDDKQRELALALVELLIGAAQESQSLLTNGGGDELKADC